MAKIKKSKSTTVEKQKGQEKYLFFMLPNEVGVKEFQGKLSESVERTSDVWCDINVMEFQVSSGNMVYFEQLDSDSWDGSDGEFLKEKSIEMVYGVIFDELDQVELWPYLQLLVSEYGGFICEDSDDFQPIYLS